MATIKEARQVLRQADIPLLVIYLPMKLAAMGDQVAMDEWSKARLPRRWRIPADRTLASQLKGVCSELDIPSVDTTRRLQDGAAAGELVFYPFDTHVSRRGHQIISEMIANAVSKILG